MRDKVFIIFSLMSLSSCSQSQQDGRSGGLAIRDSGCDGRCTNQNLTSSDVERILKQALSGAQGLNQPATIAVVDRVGNVLAVYQESGARALTRIDGQVGATGELEGLEVSSALAAISKAGTGAYLSSQGNAFSTRTASQIIQEHFNPRERDQAGGPLFGVQFSQLLCSDLTVRQSDFDDETRSSGAKPAAAGLIGPRPLPLGLSADPGGLPLYKEGDLVGGIGIEFDGIYGLDRDVWNLDNHLEERVALIASVGFEAPSNRVAPNVNVGKSLRYTDLGYENIDAPDISAVTLDLSRIQAITEFSGASIREGAVFGESTSGILQTSRIGIDCAILVDASGNSRYPTQAGSSLSGSELSSVEVDALLDSALLTASRTRAAIRRPLSAEAQVSIWIVDHLGLPLGFVRSVDAPVFGIDVALQKARSSAFFSSVDAGSSLESAGFGTYVSNAQSLLGANVFTGAYAFSNRAIGNIARPFFPDGISSRTHGPLSLPFPGSDESTQTWSPLNTGLQLDLVFSGLARALGLEASATFPATCTPDSFARRIGGGIQIFSGAVPLYRGSTLIGGIGISGDGINQDDLIAFYSASRAGLDQAGHTTVGDSILGFNAPLAIRSDQIPLPGRDLRLRYVNCPEAPFRNEKVQNLCAGL